MFFKDRVWEEVKVLYGLWKEKFFIKDGKDFENEIDIYDSEKLLFSNNNGRIYDTYEPTNFALRDYGIKWRRVNEYYRLWNEYQEDSFKINKRKASLLFRDVML